ncbi:hypothetical protein CR513_03588, partial [Mucuna pruriens]
MNKKASETLKEYAQQWREVAMHVQPPLSEKEMVTMFIETLQLPFYEKMVGSIYTKFFDLVVIGEWIELGVRNGRISHMASRTTLAKKAVKKGEANIVTTDRTSNGTPQKTFGFQPVFQSKAPARLHHK